MDPLESIRTVRRELERVTTELLAGMPEVPAALRDQLARAKEELSRAEGQVAAAATSLPAPADPAKIKAKMQERVAGQLGRVKEIQALRAAHGSNWVFAPSAVQQAAAAVPPLEAGAMPGLVRSMFEQLDIRPGGKGHVAFKQIDDREIWEDLSQSEQGSAKAAESSGTKPGEPQPVKPTMEPRENAWDDLSQIDE